MFDLKKFQNEAAKLMSDRYAFFAGHPDRPRKGKRPRPFFQALSALTGAGKTPVLAQSVAWMRVHFESEPIILWMSTRKSVVAQTFMNFTNGGKYSSIIDGFQVINVQDLTPALIADGTSTLLVMTTTGLFNNKDQSEGSLNIYKKGADLFGEQSPWERLIERKDGQRRRPLIIVYDEGHRLSSQQSDILAELEPDAYLLASATLKLPESFQKSVIQPIKLWVEEADDTQSFIDLQAASDAGSVEAERFVTTVVSSERVVKAELVKKAIQFDGTTAPMERCLDELISRKRLLDSEIAALGLLIQPKAIYICKTNVADDGQKDDPAEHFLQRKAPPIRIWRYLVEQKGISPEEIAIYANLSFAKGCKPDNLNLYGGSESDFDTFQSINYKHIIFNLALEEGWDDPLCYLAYIDKSMGSNVQVQQLIGRALRQPGAEHYDSPLLNSAHFFIRVDNENVFADAIRSVKDKLRMEGAPIEISSNYGGAGSGADDLSPKEGVEVELHHIYVDSEAARERIAEIVDEFPIFEEGDANTIGDAQTATHVVELLELENDSPRVEWKVEGHTNLVRLHWLVSTAVRAQSARALAILNTNEPKFAIRVQVGSTAAKLAGKLAREVAEAFYSLSDLVYESLKPFNFGILRVPRNAPAFSNGLYERYAGFNRFELEFAYALDKVGLLWHRNPSAGGFHIPLLSDGDTSSFYPDFIAWKNGMVFCLDTKGGHLLSDAVARKLFDVKEDGKSKVAVRFIVEGKQTELRGKTTKGGFTVWKMKAGSPHAVQFADLDKAVAECLR